MTYGTKGLKLQIRLGIWRKIYHSEILHSICFQQISKNWKMSLILLEIKIIHRLGISDELVNIFFVKCTNVNFYTLLHKLCVSVHCVCIHKQRYLLHFSKKCGIIHILKKFSLFTYKQRKENIWILDLYIKVIYTYNGQCIACPLHWNFRQFSYIT